MPPPRSAIPPSSVTASQPTGSYVIGPGDKLGVFVFDQPQLSLAEVPVRPDGRISTPLVPDVVAAGKTPAELSAELTERLKKFIKDPNVTIIVHSFVGPFNRQIRVIGEATEPLSIPYSEHMTLLDVMIEAKGLTKFAAGNRAVVVRTTPGGKEERIPVRLQDLLREGDTSQNLEMLPGDTLIIPQSWF